jgi:hypothetical protein
LEEAKAEYGGTQEVKEAVKVVGYALTNRQESFSLFSNVNWVGTEAMQS